MYEMKNVARIIEITGGLDKLASSPVQLDILGTDSLCIELLGPGLHGEPTRLISVSWLKLRSEGSIKRVAMTFEIIPSDNEKIGWRSGTWLPVSFRVDPGNYHIEAMVVRNGKVIFNRVALPELRATARHWNHCAVAEGFLWAAEEDAAEEQRLRSAEAKRQRALLRATTQRRPRDEHGRFLKLA